MAGIWHIIVPKEATNKMYNPTFNTTANYTAQGGAAVARVASEGYTKYGIYALRITMGADNDGVALVCETLNNAAHYFKIGRAHV